VSSSASPTLTPIVPDSVHRESAAHFAAWALAELQIPTELAGDELIVQLPLNERSAFDGAPTLRLADHDHATPEHEPLAWDSRFGRWLRERLASHGPVAHARPARQPMAVNDVTAKLFGAYAIEGGQLRLAGCQLTDHPFLRLSYAAEGDDAEVRHLFVAPDGSAVSDELTPQLSLDELEPILKHPPRIDDAAVRSLIAAGRRIAAKHAPERDPAAAIAEPLAAAVLWVRHAEGRLQFTIGAVTVDHPFSGWASLLRPQPYVGKESGVASFSLGVTDEGEIEPVEEIAVCQKSGRRVLRRELVDCSVTGLRVLPEFTELCPVSGHPALRGEFVNCKRCRQRVSKAVLREGICSACQSLAKVSKDDPRLVWIFGEHPGLDRWKSWRLAETGTAYIAQASSLLKQLLVVIDKESLTIKRIAQRSRLSKTWIDLDEASREDMLR
jgi:hypothetical protein